MCVLEIRRNESGVAGKGFSELLIIAKNRFNVVINFILIQKKELAIVRHRQAAFHAPNCFFRQWLQTR